MSYPYRKGMLDDLIQHHQIKGLTYKQLIDSIGEPTGGGYEIVVDYGWDIDPVYIQSLLITFNTDSVVTNFEVKEWRH